MSSSLTQSGYVVTGLESDDITKTKKELTVRPDVNAAADFGGGRPPSFKVFRFNPKTKALCVPTYYGLKKFGVVTTDKRPEPADWSSPEVVFKGTLRTETSQPEALQKAIESGGGVLSLPCGYGKTTVALAIASHWRLRTMIIVHKEFLANQWRERIQQFCQGATIGLVQADKFNVEGCDFVIAMLQSLSMREYDHSVFESIGTLIVDEAHHICAKVFSQGLFKLCPQHSYGLSATPVRKDGLTRVLHWFLGPTFFSIERTCQKQVEVFTGEYNGVGSAYREPPPCNRLGKVSLVQMITDLVEDSTRNRMLVDLIKDTIEPTRKVLILSDRRLHCEALCGQFAETEAGLYMGGMKEADLEKSSQKRLIFGTFSQAHEGLDIPTLDTIILTTPKSDITQAVGRILRETPGKQHNPHIYDIWDKWCLLNSMYYKRRKVYKHGGFVIHGETQPPTLPIGTCLIKN
jgi:superfamily II DNA or RNA helicase